MKIEKRKSYDVYLENPDMSHVRCGIMPGREVRMLINGANEVGDGIFDTKSGKRYVVWEEVCENV